MNFIKQMTRFLCSFLLIFLLTQIAFSAPSYASGVPGVQAGSRCLALHAPVNDLSFGYWVYVNSSKMNCDAKVYPKFPSPPLGPTETITECDILLKNSSGQPVTISGQPENGFPYKRCVEP